MNIDEAVKLWVERDFSNIPTELIKKAFKDDFEELELLSSKYPELDKHIREVEECGFLVYESDETGILLGVDGCGYDFYEDHWKPLYVVRNLHWHDE